MVSLGLITTPRTIMVATGSAFLIIDSVWSKATDGRLLKTINSVVSVALSFRLLLSAHREMLSNSYQGYTSAKHRYTHERQPLFMEDPFIHSIIQSLIHCTYLHRAS